MTLDIVRAVALPILLAAPPFALPAAAEPPLRTVGFLVLPGVYNSELMAPYDVLDHVRFRTKDAPRIFTVAPRAGPLRTFEGLILTPHYTFADAPPVDLLVVPSVSRVLARLLGVSRNTVLTAYDELVAGGLIEGRRGAAMLVRTGCGRQRRCASSSARCPVSRADRVD